MLLQQLEIHPCWIYKSGSLKTRLIMIGKTLINLRVKAVQMKSLALYFTNKKLSFDIFTVENLWNMIFTILMNFWHKIQIYNFDIYNVFLTIATNIPVLLMTAPGSHISYNKNPFAKLFLIYR